MIEESEDIKWIPISCYTELETYLDNSNCIEFERYKAAVVVFIKDFQKEIPDKQRKDKMLDRLCNLQVLTVAVMDCCMSSKSIDFILSFDFCLATERSELRLDDLYEMDYFPADNTDYLLGKYGEYSTTDISGQGTDIQERLVNRWIHYQNLKSDVYDFLEPILLKKDEEYIHFIKQYFNLYKSRKPMKEEFLRDQEIKYFCRLALDKNK